MIINKEHIVAFFLLTAILGLTAFQCSENIQDENQENLCGAYTGQRAATEEEMELFCAVIGSIDTTTEYTALSVATQVVAGINYRFLCSYKDKEGASSGYCFVIIYKPLQGDPELSGIEKR